MQFVRTSTGCCLPTNSREEYFVRKCCQDSKTSRRGILTSVCVARGFLSQLPRRTFYFFFNMFPFPENLFAQNKAS